jgi:hypothetical protein
MKMIDINFSEPDHRYYNDEGRTFISVTTLIGKYEPKYDQDFWSMYTGLKNHGFRVRPQPSQKKIYISNVLYKLSDLKKDSLYTAWQKEVLAKWEVITIEACERGNDIHNELEDNVNLSKGDVTGKTNNYILPVTASESSHRGKQKVIETVHDLDATNLFDKYPFVHDRLAHYLGKGCSIFAEKRVFLEKEGVAGMIDLPIFKGNKFCILDWKTNKDEFHDTPGYYKKIQVNGEWVKSSEWVPTDDRMEYPLDNILASKLNKYALQLSLYAYILERWGYELVANGLEIIHFPLGQDPRVVKIPYLKREVELMLNHYMETA